MSKVGQEMASSKMVMFPKLKIHQDGVQHTCIHTTITYILGKLYNITTNYYEWGIAVFCAICDWQQTDWLTKRVAFVTEKPFFFHFFFHIFTHVEHFNFVFLYQIFMISSILRGLLYTFHPSSAHVESQSNNSKAFLKWGICPRYGSVWKGVAKCARGFW